METTDLLSRMRRWGGTSAPLPKAPEAPAAAPSPAGGAATPTRASGEPQSEAEATWRMRVHTQVLKQLDLAALSRLNEPQAREEIRAAAQHIMNQESMPLPAASRQRIAQQIEDEIMGLGPLEPLLADKTVADVLVNGPDQVYVERKGKLELTDVKFQSDAHLMGIIERIVARVGRRVDEASPMVDARLADGSRVNAIIPPLALDGALLSIRRFSIGRLTVEELTELGAMTKTMAEVLNAIVKARLNVLISGGTGSGKTTLLNVMSGFIPANERIVTIEDSAELQLQQPHVCRLETRPRNIEGRGEVTQRDLVRNALRMRPDRIIVGEVRGGESFDMLQAMNTGHDGSLTTIHANTPRDALARVDNMVAMAGMNLPSQAVLHQIAAAIHVVVQAERMEDGRRRVVSIQELEGMEGNTITMSEIFRFARRGLDKAGNVVGQFEPTGLVPKFMQRMRQRGIPVDPAWFEPGRKG